MNIKNYTSTVDASKSMAKIIDLLVEIGATDISQKFENKMCIGITFLYTDVRLNQTLAFNLKANVDECFKILWKEIRRPQPDSKQRTMQQANRTAWKIICDWVEIQCSMILLKQAEPLQMFLPYVFDVKSQETLYDKVVNGKLNNLLTQ